MTKPVMLLVVGLACVACGAKTPATPTTPSVPTGAFSTAVRVSDDLSELPLSGVTPTVGARTMGASASDGRTALTIDQAGQYFVAFAGSGVFTRTARLNIPGQETSVALIPANFDLTAFDQLFRSTGKLQRWRSAPPLVVVTKVLQFESTTANQCTVLDEPIGAGDVQSLVADLTDGLSMLTDGRFTGFAAVTIEDPTPGSHLDVLRSGVILVARSSGLTKGSTYWGYGRWASNGDGAIVAGNVMIDSDFEKSASPYHRSLHVHELGHALGYGHVTARQSFMNSTAVAMPNAWDAQAVHIAFQRQPGSITPDTDPTAISLNIRRGAPIWGPPM